MKIIRYDLKQKPTIIAYAMQVLASGGTVIYPTETAYGLGADFYSPSGYRRVYAIKSRAGEKPLPVIVPNRQYATTLVRFSPKAAELAMKYWPGPLTLVLPFLYRSQWPHHRDDYLALRVSSHPFAADLAQAFGRPITSTSANVSGEKPGYSIEEIVERLSRHTMQPDLIIDAGVLPHVPASTIVRVGEGAPEVLRAGSIKIH